LSTEVMELSVSRLTKGFLSQSKNRVRSEINLSACP